LKRKPEASPKKQRKKRKSEELETLPDLPPEAAPKAKKSKTPKGPPETKQSTHTQLEKAIPTHLASRLEKQKEKALNQILTRPIDENEARRTDATNDGKMLYLRKPQSQFKSTKVDCSEIDVIDALRKLATTEEGEQSLIPEEVRADKSGFIIIFKTIEEASKAKGKVVFLKGQRRPLETYRGGGSSLFMMKNTRDFSTGDVVEGLSRVYGPKTFRLYKAKYYSTSISGCWWVEFQEPEPLRTAIALGSVEEKEKIWTAVLMVAKTAPCDICREVHADKVCPHSLSGLVAHPKALGTPSK